MSEQKSPMRRAFNVTFPNGTYKDKDGKEKTRWLNVGTIFISEDRKRMALKIDAVPTSKEFEGWLNVFPISRGDGSTVDQAKAADQSDGGEIDDKPVDLSEIPF